MRARNQTFETHIGGVGDHRLTDTLNRRIKDADGLAIDCHFNFVVVKQIGAHVAHRDIDRKSIRDLSKTGASHASEREIVVREITFDDGLDTQVAIVTQADILPAGA